MQLPLALALAGCGPGEPRLRTGLEVLQAEGFRSLRNKRVGVITNPTGVDRDLRGLPELIAAAQEVELAALFAPEHGFLGAAPAGEQIGDARYKGTGVPVYSLYGKVRRPTRSMLEGIDVLLFDIQDVGVRAYTYLATLTEALAAAREAGIELWVLDRPVPIGGDILEGPLLEPGRESFVGPHTVPLRHGLTAGEFARLVNEERGLHARLHVVPMAGYHRDMSYDETGLLWVAPSPNIPGLDSAHAYAGMVLIEATNLSEGRGTTRPFQLIGAPWVDGERLAAELNALGLPGCRFRPARFVPTASKHQGEDCGGVELHITSRRALRPVTAAVALLAAVERLHPGKLELRADLLDRLAGTPSLRQRLEEGAPLETIVAGWQPGLAEFQRRRERFLLYR